VRLERIVTLALVAAVAAALASVIIINAPAPEDASAGVRCAEWRTITQVQKDRGPVGRLDYCVRHEVNQ
jgi:hypothetical protein